MSETCPLGCPTAVVTDMDRHLAWHAECEAQGIPRGPVNATTCRETRGLVGTGAIEGGKKGLVRQRHLNERLDMHRGSPKVRRDASDTSRRAASLVLPKAGTQRAAVLAVIAGAGRHPTRLGATDKEVSEHLGLSLNSVRPRRLELQEAGIIGTSDREREGHTVWRLTQAFIDTYGAGDGACKCPRCTS